MGFCTTINPYTNREVLCCDFCNDYPARKIKCPFGYCQAYAMCKRCRAENKGKKYKEEHRARGCEKNHLEFIRLENEREEMLRRGEYLRVCASSVEQGVKVLFENKDKDIKAFLMSANTYHQIPLFQNVTPDNFRAFGTLRKMANLDIYNREGIVATTKEVTAQEFIKYLEDCGVQ